MKSPLNWSKITGFLPGGGKIYCYTKFYCANFSIVFGLIFLGGEAKLSEGGQTA